VEEVDDVADHAITTFQRHGHSRGLARAWYLVATGDFVRGRFQAADQALEQALQHARVAQDVRGERRCLVRRASVLVLGPTPVGEAIETCAELHAKLTPDRGLQAVAGAALAQLLAMDGRFGEARQRYRQSKVTLAEVGNKVNAAGLALYAAPVELLAGDVEAAVAELRAADDLLGDIGETGARSSVAALLAQAAYAAGDIDETRRFAELSRESSSPDDVLTWVIASGALAKALARLGRGADAERLASETVALTQHGDFLDISGDATLDLAHVLRAAGSERDSVAAAEKAIGLYERKGNVVSAARARALIGTIGAGTLTRSSGRAETPVSRERREEI
jgi:tetratricopeptide (TPR) repeat protein